MPIEFSRIQGPAQSATSNFEKLCAHLVKLEFSTSHPVDGKGGDGGVDAFIGTLPGSNRTLAVFQFKFFTETLKAHQRRQIEESLATALNSSQPQRWTLCLPKTLTPSEHLWWNQMVSDHRTTVEIHLWDETVLRQKLLEHPQLNEQFFPQRFTEAQQRQLRRVLIWVAATSVAIGLTGLVLSRYLPRSAEPVQVLYDPNRPKDILPQAFYINHDLIPIRNFPLDLYLGVKVTDFTTRYGSLVKEEPSPSALLKLYRLKPGAFTPERTGGWINEGSTVFVFDSGTLAAIVLSIVVPPENEPRLLGELDRGHPIGFGSRYDQGSIHIWMSERGRASELLSLSHGSSSGVNELALFSTEFPLNDLLLRIAPQFPTVPKIPATFDALRNVLSSFQILLSSDTYRQEVHPQLGIANVNLELAVKLMGEALGR